MRFFTLVFIQLILVFSVFAQKEEQTPVSETFNCSMLSETQTIMSPYAKGYEFIIHHRFGLIKDFSDLLGFYAPSNIRLGIDYGITDRLMLGFGTEKNNKHQDLRWKYALLRQTESGSMPVSVSYFGNTVLDANNSEKFGQNYKFIDRLSYFNQIIVARKFNDKFSFQVAGSYSHFNKVDSIYQNDAIGLTAAGMVKLTYSMSLMFEYNHSIYVKDSRYYHKQPEPGLGLGLQIATGTHAFQVFATTYDNITPQSNFIMNSNQVLNRDVRDPLTGQIIPGEKSDLGIRFGFNITARF
ncbi:MAG: hypothetical protein JXR58_04205 [Bacteroidales bacterium]|nr:hypothetical protein [Bacteroidales bacterium]